MVLFKKDSPEDLAMRGMNHDYIFRHTGFDSGDRNRKLNSLLKGLDRYQYKVEYVKTYFTHSDLIDIIHNYCGDRLAIMHQLGIFQDKLNMKLFFSEFGLDDEYIKATRNKSQMNREQTMISKYGVKHALQSNAVKEKHRKTCFDKYGVDNPMKSDTVKSNLKKSLIDKYGVEHSSQIKSSRIKAKNTYFKKYGVDNPMKSDVVKLKMRTTMLEKYGVTSPMMLKSVQDKAKNTCMRKYGKPYASQNDEIREKLKNILNNQEIKDKINNTKRKNHTFNSSHTEELLYKMLVDKFGKDDVFRQYKDERYPFMCDFYIKSRDLFIELNAYWTHGDHWFGSSLEDNDILNDWIDKSKTSKFYERAIDTWTRSDVLKHNLAIKNKLNFIAFFDDNLKDVMRWIEADCPNNKERLVNDIG